MKITILWLGLLVSSISSQKAAFDLGRCYVGLQVDKVALEEAFFEVLVSPLTVSFYQLSIASHLSVVRCNVSLVTGHVFKLHALESRKGIV
jgi:hypothetical protein